MSYILDALKRADAERERGAVPGLHSQSLATPVMPNESGHNHRTWLALATLVACSGIAAGIWLWPTPASKVALPVVAPVATPPVVKPEPVLIKAPPAAPPQTQKATPIKAIPNIASTPAPVPAAAPLLSELPEELRRQIPTLVVTGAVYSETPANRLLLLNNQVLTQGSLAAPEVILEEIRPKSSVFNFKGTRFRLAH
ncbi:MAG: general secretion pathway protein GspB [Rhodoferax sp.]|uniref:general secretion pathway protein GspB n=1 Tax=Rhodoferax sp. TaxID=50421 RepID=UPI0030194EFD